MSPLSAVRKDAAGIGQGGMTPAVADDRTIRLPDLAATRRIETGVVAPTTWDYLVVTASNAIQAEIYQQQIGQRRVLETIGNVLVVADPRGMRIGSGGSTILCLMEVLRRELLGNRLAMMDPTAWRDALGRLRILIVHGGGDSRRLPPYAPCGKLFVPLPGFGGLVTLFDQQLATYLRLPATPVGVGQIVIAAGDVLVDFDPAEVNLAAEGITGLGCPALPEEAARHGVYWAGTDGEVELFLQKPSVQEQHEKGVVNSSGRSTLDVGIMSFDAATAVKLLDMCPTTLDAGNGPTWTGPLAKTVATHGLDFYREIACALGRRATPALHAASARQAGSQWDDARLAHVFRAMGETAFHVCVPASCGFLHWGTVRQLLESGAKWSARAGGESRSDTWVGANNEIGEAGAVFGARGWVEGCRIQSPLVLECDNLVVGVDVDTELTLPPGACLDVMPGWNRHNEKVFFVRCYGADDDLQGRYGLAGTYCSQPLAEWLTAVGAVPDDVWDASDRQMPRSLWNARVIPAETDPGAFRRWLWMFDPARASQAEKEAWRCAERYSFAEMASLADCGTFHQRRTQLRANAIWRSARQHFHRHSDFSAVELAHLLRHADDPSRGLAEFLVESHRAWETSAAAGLDALVFSRMMHTLGSAVLHVAESGETRLADVFPHLDSKIPAAETAWLTAQELLPQAGTTVAEWSARAKNAAFRHLGQTIMASGARSNGAPASVLRSDEIVWGRAPARLDLCGGWTDTPPYALEFGGCVLNAAVNLNGQPPIQAFARVTEEPVIRLASIDRGTHIQIRSFEELLDDRGVDSEFSLVKTALVLSGIAPGTSRRGKTLQAVLESVGGGIELTTLAAIPKGSGLGTSSIMGALVLAVLDRVLGRTLKSTELFHRVLQLEQAMTTGGGWQDQIGGVVGGVKLITTMPGLVPEPNIQSLRHDVLSPVEQCGQILLYYTGITRLAKNILQRVVARYLDRDPTAVAALAALRQLARQGAEAMAHRDFATFGHCVDAAWQLNKRLDPECSNEAVESILARSRPYLHGAKLLGAGGGGFLLLVCRSPRDAWELRAALEAAPENSRARFFSFDINQQGLCVTVC